MLRSPMSTACCSCRTRNLWHSCSEPTLLNSPSQNARDVAAIFSAETAPKSVFEQLADAKTQLGTFMGASGIQRLLSRSDFLWTDSKNQVVTIYKILPEQHAKAYARLTRLTFTSGLKAHIAPPRADILYIMD